MTRFVACLMAVVFFSAAAWAQKSSLNAGEYLTTGQYLQSPNKNYLAVQQKDGNFCIYKGSPTAYQGGALWCHNVVGPGTKFFTMLNGDGNLCTYRVTQTAGIKTWCTKAVMKGGQFLLQQQDDGNLCVIHKVQVHWPGSPSGASATFQVPIWCALNKPLPTVAIGDPQAAVLFNVSNDSPKSVWVTIYGEGDYTGPKIKATGCLEPGQKGEVHAVGYGNLGVRGEQTQTPHCQQPVACDTSVQEAGGNLSVYNWRSIIFRSSGNCWWDFAP